MAYINEAQKVWTREISQLEFDHALGLHEPGSMPEQCPKCEESAVVEED